MRDSNQQKGSLQQVNTVYSSYQSALFPYVLQNFYPPLMERLVDIQFLQQNSQKIHSADLQADAIMTKTNSRDSQSTIDLSFKKQKKKREKNCFQKEMQSARKNSESNVINQLFSYFSCRAKSEKTVQRAIMLVKPSGDLQKRTSIFYNVIRSVICRRGRRYVNRDSLTNFFTPETSSDEMPGIEEGLQQTGLLSLKDYCRIFRRCCWQFLRELSVPAISTSKRVSLMAKKQHLKRRRVVLNAIQISQHL